MLHKKFLALLCACMMLFSIPFAQAEESDNIQDSTPDSFVSFVKRSDTLTYQGGVVMRGFVKGADMSSPLIELAYVMTSAPYIILDQSTHWELTISGGEAPYTCYVALAHQSDLSMDQFGSYKVLDDFTLKNGNYTFDYTFTKPGRYFWEFRVEDENGQYVIIQTRIYEAYTEADETDESTVVGKVNSIIDELITKDMSDYTRALVLHDWLIYNANYDYTYKNYDAAGVLLKGTGVCDSYGRAYLMLCTAAGVECIYLSGTAGNDPNPDNWGAHGWNMVKINGKWYHVDCTWDDPGKGGYENHDYFCIDDETMARDHRWNRPDDVFDEGYLPPEADSDDLNNSADNHLFTFSSYSEFSAGIDALAASGDRISTIRVRYVGTAANKPSWEEYQDWCAQKINELAQDGLVSGSYSMGFDGVDLYTIVLPWKNPTKYISIDETNVFLSIGETVTIYAADFYPLSNSFTWKSSNTGVATVTGAYGAAKVPYATITGVSAGEAQITASVSGGKSDTFTVTVLPELTPDFDLGLTEEEEGVIISWNAIPGATEYQIIRVQNGKETLLGTTYSVDYFLTDKQLPDTVNQQIYVVGLRVVAGETVATYTSNPITYGRDIPTLTYSATLPEAVTAIDAEAFAGDVSLTAFEVPGKVKTIGERAFAGCTALKLVCIPKSVTSIGANAFANCPLEYAEVEKNSYAAQWMAEHYPDVYLVY